MVCDLARDSLLLSCRHCGKGEKTVANFMKHLRTHGVKRFLCGICQYRADAEANVRKHMKNKHCISDAANVPTPGPGPAQEENIIFTYYSREIVRKLNLRSNTPGESGAS